ncbi:hypothetical protein BDP27DRAFT_1347077 [Rhodocollybia butyracea]|uniref:Uncharacterized protein n=1 Tax=Rhodocollybia butyracea TaxID=206335 RepID=A0A9P5TW50_9AGAR|nr:hypothetical protein BDP27DRAFT_1347077 [Rhodocollybia butyracea]
MPFRLSRRSSQIRSFDSSENHSTGESTKKAQCFSQLVHKSKTLFSFVWIKDVDEQTLAGARASRSRTRTCLRSPSVIELLQPRPELHTYEISWPRRPGSRSGNRHSRSNPHGRHSSHSQVNIHSSNPRSVAPHPPRFNSVVRREVPRYSTIARPTHTSIMISPINFSPPNIEAAIVNVDGTNPSAGELPETPPPAYSRFYSVPGC